MSSKPGRPKKDTEPSRITYDFKTQSHIAQIWDPINKCLIKIKRSKYQSVVIEALNKFLIQNPRFQKPKKGKETK